MLRTSWYRRPNRVPFWLGFLLLLAPSAFAAAAEIAHLQQAVPSQQTANPPVLKRSPIRLAMLRKLYQCADGVQVIVMQERDAVRVTLKEQTYDLKLAPSSDPGTKYAAGPITWSVAGDTGTLQDGTDPSSPKLLAQNCRQQSILPPSSPSPRSSSSPTNSIAGTLSLPQSKDLPSAAVVRIRLLEVKSLDKPKALRAKTFRIGERKPPIPFELTLDPQMLLEPDCCAVYAEILVNGKAQYATPKGQPITDITHPGPVSLDLEPVHRKAAQP